MVKPFSLLFFLFSGISTAMAAQPLWQLQPTTGHLNALSQSFDAEFSQSRKDQQINTSSSALSYNITIDQPTLNKLAVGQTIELPMPNGVYYWSIEALEQTADGITSIRGKLSDDPQQQGVGAILTYSADSIFGNFTVDAQTFALQGTRDAVTLKPAASMHRQPGHVKLDDVKLPAKSDLEHKASNELTDGLNIKQLLNRALPLTMSSQRPSLYGQYHVRNDFADERDERLATIDVLVLYSQSADDLYGGDAKTRIQHLFNAANQAFEDSGAYVRVNPVAFRKVNPAAPELQNHIDEMVDGRNGFANLSQWRQQTGADVVTLFTPIVDTSFYCGQAQVSVYAADPQDPNSSMYMLKDSTHSAVHIDCDDGTFAHEMGHHLGLSHGNGIKDKGYSFPYARGYFVHQDFTTVMVYSHLFAAQRLLVFSNPEKSCQGQPCGQDKHSEQGADAVSAINKIRFIFTENEPAQPPTLSFADAIAMVKDPALKSCLVEIQQRDPSLAFAHELTTLGYYPWQGCSPQDPNGRKITDLSDLLLFPNLQGITLHAGNIEDFTALTQLPHLYELDLYLARKPTSLPWISQLTQLRRLSLQASNLGSSLYLAPLKQLSYLNLSYNGKLDDYSGLNALSNLTSLSVSGNFSAPFLTDLNFLANKPKLTKLTLNETQLTSLEDLALLAPNQLKQLSVETDQPIQYAGLADQQELESLSLHQSAQSDCQSLAAVFPGFYKLRTYSPPSNCRNHSLQPPSFLALDELRQEAKSLDVNYVELPRVTADDAEDGVLQATPDRIAFPIGSNTIRWRAIDSQNNITEQIQRIIVRDSTAPFIYGPDFYVYDNPFNSDVGSDYYDQYDYFHRFYADDIISGYANLAPSADADTYMNKMRMEKSAQFTAGVNQVVVFAKDNHGNEQRMVSYFVNQWRDAPRFENVDAHVPVQMHLSDSSGVNRAQIQAYIDNLVARDKNGIRVGITATIPDKLPPGRHYIALSAIDSANYRGGQILTLDVGDFAGPVFADIPDLTIYTASTKGINAEHPQLLQLLNNLSAQDDYSAPVRFEFELAERYALGKHQILLTAVDTRGNSTTKRLNLTVEYKPSSRSLLKLLLMAKPQT